MRNLNAFSVRCARLNAALFVCSLLLSGVVVHSARAAAGTASLAWDPNTEDTVIGYRLYFGLVGGNATNSMEVVSTTATVPNLPAGSNHFFFVTAFDAYGQESTPSTVLVGQPVVSQVPATNTAPELPVIADQTVVAGGSLALDAVATDPNTASGQVLSYSLGVGAPAGASIDSSSGRFTWTPSLAQGGTSYVVTIRVTDNGSPALSDSLSLTITVTAAPLAPATGLTGCPAGVAGAVSLSWIASPSAGVTGYAVYYGVAGSVTTNRVAVAGPSSAVVSGLQGGIAHFFQVAAVNGLNQESARTSPVTVSPSAPSTNANCAPRLNVVTSTNAPAGRTLVIQPTATDADVPAQALTFSLGPYAPQGATVDPATGRFTWSIGRDYSGYTYNVKIIVMDNGSPAMCDERTVSIIVVEPTVQPVPNLTGAPGSGAGKVNLSWTASADPYKTGYRVYYGVAGTGVTNKVLVGATTTSLVVSNLQGGISHFFFVKVVNDLNMESPASTVINVTPTLPGPANTPPRLVAINNTNVIAGQTLTLMAQASDSDSPAQTLRFTTNPDFPAGAQVDPVTGQFTWTPSRNLGGTEHEAVIWVTDSGTPALSDEIVFVITVNSPAPPAPVTLSRISSATVGSVSLSWTASSDPYATSYRIYYTRSGSGVTNTVTLPSSLTTTTLNNLESGATYFFQVTVINDLNMESPPSNLISATATTPATPNTPPRLYVVTNTTGVAGQPITFVAQGTDSDAPAQALLFSLDPGAPAGAQINSSSGRFDWTPARGMGGSNYNVVLRVSDSGSPSLSATGMVTIHVDAPSAPAPVTLFAAPATIARAVNLAWSASKDAFKTGYRVYYGVNGSAVTNKVSVGAGTTTMNLSNLQSGVCHFFMVRVVNDLNLEGPPSNIAFVTPGDQSTENSAPRLSVVTSPGALAGRTLTFTASAVDSDVPVQTLTYSLGPSSPAGASIDPVTGRFTWNLTSNLIGYTYYVRVIVTDNGAPALSDSRVVRVAVANPSTVSEVLLSGTPGVNPGTVELAWTATTNGSAVGYKVYYGVRGWGSVNSISLPLDARSVTVTNLESGISHYFFVRVATSDGREGIASDVANVTPDSTANTPPVMMPLTNVVAKAGDAVSFSVAAADPDVLAPEKALTSDAAQTQVLTYTLDAGAPAGAQVHPVTGQFSWTPDRHQCGSNYTFRIWVLDNGTPAMTDVQTVTVAVICPDSPVTPSLAAPVNLQATLAGANRVQLAWDYGTNVCDGFRVERSIDGVNFGVIGVTAAGVSRFTAQENDVPYAFAYPYWFRVCALRAGQSSLYSRSAIAITNVADLVITSLETIPAFPAEGQPVIFRATIKNLGQAATPHGINARLAFYADGGEAVAWADNTDTLWPGQSTTVTATSGPNGTNIWIATAGQHVFTAIADDANWVLEEEESNNRFDAVKPIALAGAPEISVSVDRTHLLENGQNVAIFTITRSGLPTNDLPVEIDLGGTAREGLDYTCDLQFSYAPHWLVIPAGAMSVTAILTPLENRIAMASATVRLSVVASVDYRLGDSASATVTIQDSGATGGAPAERMSLVTARANASGQATVVWSSTPGATYRVYARTGTGANDWMLVCPAVAAAGNVTQWVNPFARGISTYGIVLVR